MEKYNKPGEQIRNHQYFDKLKEQIVFRIDYIVVCIIIFIALLIRFTGISKGLPYIHNYDEPFIASRALMMLKSGDYNPHWFQYPGLMMYSNLLVDIIHYLYLMGKELAASNFLTGLKDIVVDDPTVVQKGGFIWTISHPSFFLWNRGLTAILGTACIYYTFLIGKEITKKSITGLIAAAIIAVSSTMIYHSRFITPNLPSVLFILGAVYYAIRFNSTKQNTYLLASLVFSGLAIATKYNNGICLIAPLASYWVNTKQFKMNLLMGSTLCVIIAVITFFVVNPFTIVELNQFLSDMGKQIRHYKTGHGSHTIEPGLTHLIFQIKEFNKDFGLILLILSGMGMILSFKYKNGWFLLLFVGFYVGYMVRQRVDFHRNFLAIYPFIALWVAISINFLSIQITILTKKYRDSFSSNRFRIVLNEIPSILIFIFIAYNGINEFDKANQLASHVETRTQAINVINELTKNSNAKIAIAKELRIHQQDLRRLNVPYEIINHMDYKTSSWNYDYFVSGLFGSGRKKFIKKDSIYNAIYANRKIIKKIKGRKVNLKLFSNDPTIYIYPRRVLNPSYISVHSFSDLIKSKKQQEKELTFVGTRGGVYTSRKNEYLPGSYELKIKVKGNLVRNETAKLMISLGAHKLKEIQTTSVFTEETIKFDIDSVKIKTLNINFLNDYFNAMNNEDRNFYVQNISVLKVD